MLTDKMYDIANRISTYIISTFPVSIGSIFWECNI